MNIFIDTADLLEIREACSWGIVDGLTTNPSLIRKAVEAQQQEIDIENYIEEICCLVPGPVSLEVISLTADAMIKEGISLHRRFHPIRHNVVIKIPVNTSDGADGLSGFEGLKAIRALTKEGIPINATLVMTVEQALLCAKAGARYVSPFMGRVDDYEQAHASSIQGSNVEPASAGSRLLGDIVQIFRLYEYDCSVIAASIRHIGHVRSAELAGAEIVTLPFAVLREMIAHPKTAEGIRRFSDDVVLEYSQLFCSLGIS